MSVLFFSKKSVQCNFLRFGVAVVACEFGNKISCEYVSTLDIKAAIW